MLPRWHRNLIRNGEYIMTTLGLQAGPSATLALKRRRINCGARKPDVSIFPEPNRGSYQQGRTSMTTRLTKEHVPFLVAAMDAKHGIAPHTAPKATHVQTIAADDIKAP